MPKLEIATSLADVQALSVSAYGNEIPGFQVHESLAQQQGITPVLEAIEEGSAVATGSKVLFTGDGPLHGASGVHHPPHLDNGIRGLAVHKNHDGEGEVHLAHYVATEPPQDEKNRLYAAEEPRPHPDGGVTYNFLPDDNRVGEVHSGRFVPERLTVFSQGNHGDLLPAAHYFRREHGGRWRRFSSGASEASFSQRELQYKSRSFKNRLLFDDYVRLRDDDPERAHHEGRFIVRGGYGNFVDTREPILRRVQRRLITTGPYNRLRSIRHPERRLY